MKLDKEEKEIMDAYEKGLIKAKHPSEEELKEVKKIAEITFRKNRRITIRLYNHDYKGIQKKALSSKYSLYRYRYLVGFFITKYVKI